MSDVLVIAEHRQGEVADVNHELVTSGRELAESTGGVLHLAVISGDVNAYADILDRRGVDTIHTVEYGEEFNHDVYLQVVTQLYVELDPTVVVTPHSANGMDYAPAVANALDLSLATDVTNLDYDDSLVVTREIYGSKIETIVDVYLPALITVRSGEYPAAEWAGDALITSFNPTIDESAIRTTVTGFEATAGGDVDISEANVLVSVGRGIEDEENLDLVFDLADALDATVSSSRPVVDSGWLPKNRQVGQSGKTVSPSVYLAIGISGAVQHVAGMKGADTIIAINTDPHAPILDIADYGIVGDLFDVVPAITEQLT